MNQIVQYYSNGVCLEARVERANVWVTSDQVAKLFGCSADNIRKHARQIVEEKELDSSVGELLSLTASDGKTYHVKHWNQDMVLHIGYRVRSDRGSEFRRWATMVLKGEAPPIAPVTNAQAEHPLLAMARQQLALVEAFTALEREQSAQGARLASVEAALTVADAPKLLPEPEAEVPAKTRRKLVYRLVSRSVRWHPEMSSDERKLAFRARWNEFYAEFVDHYGTDLKRRAENCSPKRDPLDVAEELGVIEQCYALAHKLYGKSSQ